MIHDSISSQIMIYSASVIPVLLDLFLIVKFIPISECQMLFRVYDKISDHDFTNNEYLSTSSARDPILNQKKF